MYGKIQITGTIELVTGLHIGGASAFAAIGAVDSPVIRDALNNMPMIPGSSLKGKLRTLIAKQYNEDNFQVKSPNEDDERIQRLFGSSGNKKIYASRLIFSDTFLENREELLHERGAQSLTEVKFENVINRLTAVATPRQIERVIRGSQFPLDIIYEVNLEDERTHEIEEDMEMLRDGLLLLEYDYLGGSGSRGYGKVKFYDLQASSVVGNIPEDIVEKCNIVLSQKECFK